MRHLSVLAVLFLAGCETIVRFPPDLWDWDSGRWDSGRNRGTETTTGGSSTGPGPDLPLLIERVYWGCDVTETELDFVVRSNVRALDGEATLYSTREGSPTWQETHRLFLDYDDPWLATRSTGALTHDATQAGWMPNEATALHCENDVPSLSFVVRLWDVYGTMADCVLWNPTDMMLSELQDDPDVLLLGGCTLLLSESPPQ